MCDFDQYQVTIGNTMVQQRNKLVLSRKEMEN